MTSRPSLLVLFPILATWMMGVDTCRADFIVESSVTQVGQLYQYNYKLTNQTDQPIADFLIQDIDSANIVTSVESPADWDYTLGRGSPSFVDWIVRFPSVGIPPSASLSGYRIVSLYSPGDVQWSALDALGNEYEGITRGPLVPRTVPEPSSLWLALIGVGTFLFALWVRSRVRQRADRRSGLLQHITPA